MALERFDKGLTFTEEDFKTFEQKKSEMYEDLERLKKVWERKTAIELPEVKVYEKKEYLDEDQESIKNQVDSEYAESTQAGLDDIKGEYAGKRNKVNAKISEENQDYQNDVDKIKSEYALNKTNSLNKAIDQGIARSSIVKSNQERLDQDMESEIKTRKSRSELLGNTYNMELAVLESKLESALSAFEIEQAVKIKKRINDLTENVKRENEKILEYNNKMTELEQKSILAREKAIERAREEAKILEQEEKIYGYTGEKKQNYDSRFAIAKRYYMSLPRERAIKELDGDIDMHDYLGLYYSKLRNLLVSRKD